MGSEASNGADQKKNIRIILVAEPSHRHFIIIDALDESDETERAELMRLISSLALLEVDIHSLINSRTYTLGGEKGLKFASKFYNVAMKGQKTTLTFQPMFMTALTMIRPLLSGHLSCVK